MKKRIRGFFQTTLVIVLLCCIVAYLSFLLRPTDTDDSVRAIRGFHSMPENSIEVIGFGSSIMMRGLDPMVMYENYGIAAYNYGTNWQYLNTTEVFINDALTTQSPKVIVVESTFVQNILQDVDMNAQIYYTRAIEDTPVKWRYLRECFGDEPMRYLSYYLPICAFHKNWSNLTQASFTDPGDGSGKRRVLGFSHSNHMEPTPVPDHTQFAEHPLPERTLRVLDRIVQVCKEKDVEILFYIAPTGLEYTTSESMREYARENGCTLIDLYEHLDEMGFDPETDFSDLTHLNTSGSQKVADFLGKYISENYEVTDYREIEGNIWQQIKEGKI